MYRLTSLAICNNLVAVIGPGGHRTPPQCPRMVGLWLKVLVQRRMSTESKVSLHDRVIKQDTCSETRTDVKH
uniref:Uncharacterized protein n=1 Tax=Timema bartmani TaxID=61472 RepID=A0A7R9F076_9NEOP|nr:unnamed protein product [Timema bartmani]